MYIILCAFDIIISPRNYSTLCEHAIIMHNSTSILYTAVVKFRLESGYSNIIEYNAGIASTITSLVTVSAGE